MEQQTKYIVEKNSKGHETIYIYLDENKEHKLKKDWCI